MTGNDAGQNKPSTAVGLTSLPYDPFSTYLSGSKDIRVVSTTALPTPTKHAIKDTEGTYALMVHMSEGLGVNCTYCHNSQAFSSWQGSTPKRVTAWHGIRMAREINNNYITSLTDVFPANRKGPQGDVAKVNCETCHQGVFKPLAGAKMAADYPAVLGPIGSPTAVPTADKVASSATPDTTKK
jgi:photosynthetic reaction center cytochrome c subunit